MGTYYKTLSYTENDESYIGKMEEINNDLPLMRDSKDYTVTHMYPPGEKHNTACRNTIEELVYLLYGATVNYCCYNDDFSAEFKIKAAEKIRTVFETMYDDGNYGENWHNAVYNYGHLARWNFEIGNTDESLRYLSECVKLAKEYDYLSPVTEHKSLLLKGSEFKKTPKGKTLSERMKELLTEKYPFTEEFKNSAEFKNIISILG